MSDEQPSKFPRRGRNPERDARIQAEYRRRGRGSMPALATEYRLTLPRIYQIIRGRVRTPTS